MEPSLVECVPNISEGRVGTRVESVVSAITAVPGVMLLHRTSDYDHNRSVLTFAGPPDAVAEAAFQAVAQASKVIDITEHRGVHPRVGALDVLPFVPLQGLDIKDCLDLARATGARIWNELAIPVYFYEAAAMRPDRRKLEHVRRGQYEGLRKAVAEGDPAKYPDLGGRQFHPTAGAVIVGARKILVAYNVNLDSNDLGLAKLIARRVRASNGGLPGVKALGLPLPSQDCVQVSMNITDYEATPVHVAFGEVARIAAEHGVAIKAGELIGLMPRRATEMAAAALLKLADFQSNRVLENQIEHLRAAAHHPSIR